MKPTDSKATFARTPDPTGRDGAIDFAAKGAPVEEGDRRTQGDKRFHLALGAAAVRLWSDLPQPIQEQLFECAVRLGHHDERDEMLREQLAKYLHDHHKRTTGS